MRRVDRATVKAIELTAPGTCKTDKRALYKQLQNGQIFSAFDEQNHEIIWKKMLSIFTDRLIPFLFNFFKNVNYL
jgi:hypothetical protein